MAAPVWVLSVDLQTKTATFSAGMATAAKDARGAFTDIKSGAGDMGRAVSTSMTESRHSVVLLGEEMGIHLPRAVSTFIASIGPVGAAMEAAFPFLVIAFGAIKLIEFLSKLREEGDKLTESQGKFVAATYNAYNALDAKLLEAGIRADELNHNHLAALHKQLELINKQSMDELVHAFEAVSKASDAVFKELQSHWYTFGIGSAGAQHALTQFKTQYDALLAQGKDKDAADLLSGTLKSAQHVLEMQKQYNANQFNASAKGPQNADYNKFEAASLELKKAGVGVTEKEVTAQQQLVDALQAQVNIEGKVNELKGAQSANARHSTSNAVNADNYKALKAQFDQDRAAQEQEDRDREEARNQAIARLQEGEREKIDATEKGSALRLAAIDAAIKEENTKGLQETSFYRGLLVSRVNTVREMADEEARIKEEAGKEAAAHDTKMAELQLAAQKEHAQLLNAGHRVTAQQIAAQEAQSENEDYALKMAAFQREIDALDKHGKEYANKLKALQDKEEELTHAHENKLTQITNKAEMERNAQIQSAEQRMVQEFARGFSEVIMGHQSFAAMMASIGDQVLSGMIQNAIASAALDDFGKEKKAAKAARDAFTWGWENGGPAAPVLAPTLGALAFASVMAFAQGGMVPGVGRGDIVPAMLSPGEHVADKELTDGLRGMVRSGGASAKSNVHLHYRPTFNLQAIDGEGVRGMLTKHSDEFSSHFHNELRKMNR